MRSEEAAWIGERLAKFDLKTVIDIGSSTAQFKHSRPHIDRFIHAPLRKRGVRIVSSDLKPAPGVDVVGDVLNPPVQRQLRSVNADALLCCNILEHVENPARFAQACLSMVRPGALIIVSVPFSYPHHNDPIDTHFRPTPEEVGRLFTDCEVVDSAIVPSTSFGQDLIKDPVFLLKAIPLRTFWLLKLWLPRDQYMNLNHRLLWLFKRYRITCVVLRNAARH